MKLNEFKISYVFVSPEIYWNKKIINKPVILI